MQNPNEMLKQFRLDTKIITVICVLVTFIIMKFTWLMYSYETRHSAWPYLAIGGTAIVGLWFILWKVWFNGIRPLEAALQIAADEYNKKNADAQSD